MTENAPHPGWWMASDGRFYPPELHSDQAYRDQWVGVSNPTTPPAGPTTQPAAVNEAGSVANLYPSSPPTAPPQMGSPVAPSSLPAPTANVGLVSPPVAAKAAPPSNWPAGAPAAVEEPFDLNRIVAIGLFALAAVAITGAFLPWVSVSGETIEGSLTGWQRNDGKATVALAIVLAGLAGMLFVGWKSAAAKLAMVGAGIAMAVIAIVDGFNVISEGNALDTSSFDIDFSIGLGSWVTVVTGVAIAALSLVERSKWTRF